MKTLHKLVLYGKICDERRGYICGQQNKGRFRRLSRISSVFMMRDERDERNNDNRRKRNGATERRDRKAITGGKKSRNDKGVLAEKVEGVRKVNR